MMGIQVTEAQCLEVLKACNTPATKELVNNSDLLSTFVGVINGTLGALEGNAGMALGTADKWTGVADLAGKSAGNKNVHVAASTVQIFTQSLSLIKLGPSATPGAVLATVGAMLTKKVALALGMAGEDKKTKLLAASADLVASSCSVGAGYLALTAAAAAGATTIPWILLIGAVAQLGVSGYATYEAYTAE